VTLHGPATTDKSYM